MRSTKKHMLGAFLGAQGLLVATAVAHPGPPGHTHGEDWPFGALALTAGALLAAWLLRKTWQR